MMARSRSCKGDMVTGSDKDDDEVAELQRRCIDQANNGETSNFFSRCNAQAWLLVIL
jgi:hypothetical protein